MKQLNRRELLIASACVIASLPVLPIGSTLIQTWNANEVDWEEIINDVLCDNNAVLAGMKKDRAIYQTGSPHWCMEQAMQRECCT